MGRVSIPEFTKNNPGEAEENRMDEERILADRDLTESGPASGPSPYMNLEDEPADFMRGEVDVKTQMDRAADALDSSVRGIKDNSQPGLQSHGIEEAGAKTDRLLATRRFPKKH